MSRNYDNWERIVQAVLKREQYRQLAYASSRSSSISSSTVSDYDNNISRSELYQNRFMAWQKGELLGRGSFASVYEGFDEDGFFFAVKEVPLLHKGDEEKISIIQLEQEIALLSQMEHANIVQYYGTEKVESHLYIFLELVTGGSLLSLYQKHDLLDLQILWVIQQSTGEGIRIKEGCLIYIFVNIKCANILVDANGSVKLADFGITKATKLRDVNAPFWMAPEVVRSQGYGLAVDIWSLGCTVLEMLTQRFPYSNMEPCILADQQMSAIYRIGRGELPPIPDSLSSDARDFILKCLQVDANARPTASDLLDHPFVKRSFPASSRGSSFSSISSSYRFGPGSPFHEQNIHEASSTVNDTDWGRLLYWSLSDAPISLDGQLEFTCKTLGFSGNEDFGIPVAEYDATTVRSSVDPRLIGQKIEYSNGNVIEISNDRGSISNLMNQKTENSISNVIEISGHGCNKVEVIKHKRECNGIEDLEFSHSGRASSFSIISKGDDAALPDLSKKLENNARINNLVLRDNLRVKLGEFGRNSIDGVRSQVLAPPPSMSLPVMDNECSTWDIVKSFAPDSYKSFSRFERGFCLEEDEQETEGVGERRDEDEENYMMIEENGVLSTKPLFDDDSWSTTMEKTSCPSPSGRFRRFRRIIVDWQKGGLLGRGIYGPVYEGIANEGFFFAVKEVSLLDQGDEGKQRIIQFEQEIALLSQFEHENIVQYYGMEKVESHLYAFFELASKGSLLSLYQMYKLQDSQVSTYTRQILHGLKYLHDNAVLHRAINCANILVDANGLVKLTNFGLTKATKLNDVMSCKGAAVWMPPEVVRSQGYGLATDIWSLGCTVLEMLTRSFPYYSMEPMPALFRIGRGEPPPIPDSLSSDAHDFILKCLQVDASARPTASQLLDHPFVKPPLPTLSSSASRYNFGPTGLRKSSRVIEKEERRGEKTGKKLSDPRKYNYMFPS